MVDDVPSGIDTSARTSTPWRSSPMSLDHGQGCLLNLTIPQSLVGSHAHRSPQCIHAARSPVPLHRDRACTGPLNCEGHGIAVYYPCGAFCGSPPGYQSPEPCPSGPCHIADTYIYRVRERLIGGLSSLWFGKDTNKHPGLGPSPHPCAGVAYYFSRTTAAIAEM
jgi:hypothetical protein